MEKPAVADRPLLAFALSLAAALCFTAMSASVRALHGTVGTPEAVFFRGFAGGLTGLLYHLVARVPVRMSAPGVLAIRTIAGAFSLSCYYGAIQGGFGAAPGDHGALATANLLLKTAPVWVALGAGFLLGERATMRTWIALAVGVAGATIALLGPVDATVGRTSIVLGTLAGVFAAAAYLSVRRLATSEEPVTVVTFFSLGLAAVMAPIVLARWRPLPGGHGWLCLAGVAVFGTTAQLFMTHAYRFGKAAVVAVSGLTEVAFTVAAAILVFNERPTLATFAGGGLAVLAGLVATWPAKRR